MELDWQYGDMGLFWLVEDQTCHHILDYLKQLYHISAHPFENVDVNVVINGLVSSKNQELIFSKVELELVDLHPCRYV